MAFAAAGFADALVQGADFGQALKSGIISGVSAAAFYGAGRYAKTFGEGVFAGGLTGTGFSMKIALHGLIGGTSSQLQGGKFGHGFASAGFTALGTGFNNSSFIPGKGVSPLRVLIGAMIGGTASEMTGGKFANGAITGAFSQALNQEQLEKELAAQQTQLDKNNPLGLTPENAETTFGVFYPEHPNLPTADQIGPDGVALANNLITDAAQIQDVADVVQNFGPGSVVKPGLFTLARRFATDGFKGLTRDLTFEEKLGQFGGAARGGAAINPDNRLRFNVLFGGDR